MEYKKKRISQDTRCSRLKKKRIISFDVTNEEVHDDSSSLKKLINNALKNNTLKRVIADGSA